MEYIAQIIGEYAETECMPCTECGTLLGYIDCYDDFGMYGPFRVCLDEDDQIRFFICIERERISGVLCLDCADHWRCTACANYSTENCIHCDEPLCANCSLHIEDEPLCYVCAMQVYGFFVLVGMVMMFIVFRDLYDGFFQE